MKAHSLLFTAVIIFAAIQAGAQNTFPSTGRTGIYTTTPAASLQVKGGARIGTLVNYTAVDSATGNLSFAGNSQYRVAGNHYAFAFSGNPNYGLYFNQTNLRYELRDGTAAPVFFVNANDGTGFFRGNLGIGTSTPAFRLQVDGGDALINNLTIGLGAGNVVSNTAVGNFALYSNTTGNNNAAYGASALVNNTTGNSNAAFGPNALRMNTSGYSNIAAGFNALANNTTGYNNIAIGVQALAGNSSGYGTVAIGDSALFNQGVDPSGIYGNVAVGSKVLFTNTTGNGNAAVGYRALYFNTTGTYNTATGFQALLSSTTGAQNTAIGVASGNFNSSGNFNTGLGGFSLYSNATGQYNTCIGYSADQNSSNYSNSTALGSYALNTADNQVRIGDFNVTSIGGQVSWTTLSDGRVKKNIKTNIPGLTFINKLKPVSYNLDEDVVDKIIQRPAIKDKEGKTIQPSQEELTARKQKEQIIYTGFIAQDVEKAAKELNYNFSGVDIPKNDKDLYGLRYSDFVVPLVKAVQELSAENEALKTRLDKIEQMMVADPSVQNSTVSNAAATTLSGARLEQNKPNPFNQNTVISYYLPQSAGIASIQITGMDGRVIKTIQITAKGNGQLSVDAGQLLSGSYQYTLIIDGRIIDSKKMLLTK